MQLQLAHKQGKSITRPPLDVHFPELIALVEHFHQMKAEHAKKHEENFAKKLAKLDEIVKAVGKPTNIPGLKDLVKIMTELKKLQVEHEQREDKKKCDYLLTFDRDQRGLIDGKKGILFKAVSGE